MVCLGGKPVKLFFKVFVGKHDLEGWQSGAREEQFYSVWKKNIYVEE